MIRLPNLARPDIAFIGAWSLVLAAYLPIETALTPRFDPGIALMLGFNLLSAPFLLLWVRRTVEARYGPLPGEGELTFSDTDIYFLERFLYVLIALWLFVFTAGIVYSGGLPIIWSFLGSSRGYADFGIPTAAGFGNMTRVIASLLSMLLYLNTGRLKFGLIWAALFLSVASEVSRSGIFVFMCHSLCFYLILRPVRIKELVYVGLGGALLLALFLLLGQARGIVMDTADFSGADIYFGGLPIGAFWIWAYIVSPLANINFAASLGIEPNFWPYYMFQPVFPTVIRNIFYPIGDYPIPLVADSLNATTMYSPLLADFGIFGAGVLMMLFQIFCSYAYVQARRGQIFYMMYYPSLFTSLVLSIFYIYILSLSMLLVPVVCYWMQRYLTRKRRHHTVPMAATN